MNLPYISDYLIYYLILAAQRNCFNQLAKQLITFTYEAFCFKVIYFCRVQFLIYRYIKFVKLCLISIICIYCVIFLSFLFCPFILVCICMYVNYLSLYNLLYIVLYDFILHCFLCKCITGLP